MPAYLSKVKRPFVPTHLSNMLRKVGRRAQLQSGNSLYIKIKRKTLHQKAGGQSHHYRPRTVPLPSPITSIPPAPPSPCSDQGDDGSKSVASVHGKERSADARSTLLDATSPSSESDWTATLEVELPVSRLLFARRAVIGTDVEASTKKLKVQSSYCSLHSHWTGSENSTAASTPAPTPLASPTLHPSEPNHFISQEEKIDYSGLSVAELRTQLGVVGTEIAAGWNKEELIAVLEDLDTRIASLQL